MFAFFSPGPVQLLIALVVVLLLFGNRLPSTMRSLGKGITEFKRGLRDDDDASDDKIEAEEEEK